MTPISSGLCMLHTAPAVKETTEPIIGLARTHYNCTYLVDATDSHVVEPSEEKVRTKRHTD
jgi:hypothetical protein